MLAGPADSYSSFILVPLISQALIIPTDPGVSQLSSCSPGPTKGRPVDLRKSLGA